MDELVRKADVLQVLHRLGGTGAGPETWEDGWDKAIDAAFDKVDEMEAIDPAKMENRDAILEALLTAFQLTNYGKIFAYFVGKTNYDGENTVEVWYQDGSSATICVKANTGVELVREIVDALVDVKQ